VRGHVKRENGGCIIDDLDLKADDDIEKEADELALESLIPAKDYATHPASKSKLFADIESLAAHLEIHPAIVAGRVRHDMGNYKLFSKHVGHGEVRKHFASEFKVAA